MAEADDLKRATDEGPTVRPSQWLHFHHCEECHHSWSCISETCLRIRNAHISNPITGEPSLLTQISDHCKACV